VTYCGFAIDAGTRDEEETEQGMAHFVEHLIFKGTAKRRAWHILNRMENVGGDLDAYTNKEETVVYAAFLTEHLERATELLADIVFHSTFPPHEIEKETEVIIDEIQSYEDTPSELIFDDFEDMLFRHHPLGRNILGRPDQLRQFRTADALAFTQRFYRPGNMVFFVQGQYDFKRVLRLAGKYLAHLPALPAERLRTPPPPYVAERLTVHKDTHQAHVLIGARAYNAHDDRRTALYLLNNILGGPGMNSRLNVSLRERRGLVYNVESNLTSYTDTGVFCVYFGTDPADLDTCLRLTLGELRRLRDVKLTPSRLAAAKKQLIGQIGVASDSFENNALGMAKTFLHYNRYDSPETTYARIEALTAEQLLDVANEMFDEQGLSVLVYR
jgi:predicted Zn-dependent peptidase